MSPTAQSHPTPTRKPAKLHGRAVFSGSTLHDLTIVATTPITLKTAGRDRSCHPVTPRVRGEGGKSAAQQARSVTWDGSWEEPIRILRMNCALEPEQWDSQELVPPKEKWFNR